MTKRILICNDGKYIGIVGSIKNSSDLLIGSSKHIKHYLFLYHYILERELDSYVYGFY